MRTLRYVAPLVIALTFFLSACEQHGDTPTQPSMMLAETSHLGTVCGEASSTFLAGRTMEAGTVTVGNDEDSMYVTIETVDGWSMTKTHLAVASTPEDLPNKNGLLVPGLFPYASLHDPPSTMVQYVVPLSVLNGGDVAIVAVHADVLREGTMAGAWGEGTPVGKAGWASYISYELVECDGGVVVVEVGPEGGEVEFTGGGLVVPAGALGEDVSITVEPVPEEDLPPNVLPGTAFDFGPDGLVFDPPATLVLNYDDSSLSPLEEAALAIHLLDGGVLTALPSVVDTDANVVMAEVSHFSLFAIPTPVGTLSMDFPGTANPGGPVEHVIDFFSTSDVSRPGLATVEFTIMGPVTMSSYPMTECTVDSLVPGVYRYTCTRTDLPPSLWRTVFEHNVDLLSAGSSITAFASFAFEDPPGVTLTETTAVAVTPILASLPQADLSLDLVPPEISPVTGVPFQFTVYVSNGFENPVSTARFTLDATNVPFDDVSFVSVDPDYGFTLLPIAGGFRIDSAVTEDFFLGMGQTVPFMVTMIAASSGPVSVQATVYDDGTTDPLPDNNTASESTWVN